MEQKTFIPGMNSGQHAQNPQQSSAPASFYQQDETLIDGMQREKSSGTALNLNSNVNTKEGTTPVVGFLYSISKDGFPEYWPLYIGQNKIGKGADSDIILREASVSDHHADIHIKRMRQKGGRLIATIVDAGSKNGIIVNDEELDYDRHPIKNGDIVTIGLNYKLVAIIIDPVEFGLSAVEDFVALDPISAKPTGGVPTATDDTYPANSPYSNPYEGYRNQDETVNISGANLDGLNAGRTRILK